MLSLRDASQNDTSLLSLRGVALAGSFAALSVALLYCRVPEASPRTLPAPALLLLSIKYVSATVVAGLAVTWLYFRYSAAEPGPAFKSLARHLCIVWLFFPALVLMFWENSFVLLLLAPAVAATMALGLRKLLPDDPSAVAPAQPPESALFAELPPAPPGRGIAFTASLCIYGATYFALDRDAMTAGLFLTVTAWLLTSRWASIATVADREKKPASPARRLASCALVAILATLIALLPWLRTSSRLVAGLPNAHPSAHSPAKHDAGEQADAYHAILLWPFPPRQKTNLPPVPDLIAYHPGSNAAPLVIPFDGSYRYFQTPGLWLAAKAHVAHGSPLNVNIHSADWGPLFMEAHQQLDPPINLDCCREIQMEIRNGENRSGNIGLDMVLSDTTRPGRPAEILDAQPVLSSLPGRFLPKPTATDETLTFEIPPSTHLKQFNEITVVFTPAPDRSAIGARIAIRQFTLVPR
jgi:hypothetical protein